VRRSANALLFPALLLAGCGGVTSTFHDVDVPVAERAETHITGPRSFALVSFREPGALHFVANSYRPCDIVLHRTVDRTHVTVRTAPPFTGALWFAGATLSGLGAAVVGIATARGGPGEAGDLAAGISMGAAGAAALAVAAGYGLAGRDRRAHVGTLELTTTEKGGCPYEESVAYLPYELVDASGKVVASGKTDDHGVWRVADADGETAVGARVDGVPAAVGDALSGWRCRADERALFDDFAREADLALAPELGAAFVSLSGGSDGAAGFFYPGTAHVFAVTATGAAAALDADGPTETSVYTIRLNDLAGPRGLTVTGRSHRVGRDDRWSIKAHAPGCLLLLVYAPRSFAPAAK
jgi:hypothetical protein